MGSVDCRTSRCLVGARSPRLRKILNSAHRVVLTGPRDLEVPQALLGNATVVEWRRDRLVDGSGEPLIAWPRPALHEVPFRLTSFELEIREGVKNLCRLLEAISVQQRITTLILRRLRSSPPAIEVLLRRLVESQESYFHSSQAPAAKAADQAERSRTRQIIAKEAKISALQTLQQVEELPTDSKLDAFGQHLHWIIAGPSYVRSPLRSPLMRPSRSRRSVEWMNSIRRAKSSQPLANQLGARQP